MFDNVDSSNHFAYNLGVGAMGFFNDHVGIRGDVRYLRTLNGNVVDRLDSSGLDVGGFDLGGFHFWRVAAGWSFGSQGVQVQVGRLGQRSDHVLPAFHGR